MTHTQRAEEERAAAERRVRNHLSTNTDGIHTCVDNVIENGSRRCYPAACVSVIHELTQTMYGEEVMFHQKDGHWSCVFNEERQNVGGRSS
ncbi:hypothetical protein TNCV_2577181 [Trichonephila clavipes]|nr:hypothetical protein TNCV_2577181 [Trichonephila clavipes]